MVKAAMMSGDIPATPAELDRILADPRSKEYKDLRDRAAYMYLTGTYPSHLRTFFTRLLTLIVQLHTGPENTGPMRLDFNMVERMALDQHPMVRKVNEYIAQGWKIKVSKGPNLRKPYTKIFMLQGSQHATVQIDGSVKDSWD